MQIIPVIDLKDGIVVRARMGERASYAPLVTPLAATSAPLDVVAGFLALHPFKALYVADLDAIAGMGDHAGVLAGLAAAFPGLRLWVDNGMADGALAQAWLAAKDADLVIGSESQRGLTLVERLRDHPRMILSLDFRGEDFQGPPEVLARPGLWPQRVIVMTLARVGSDAGPDMARLAGIVAMAGGRKVFAAGGLRGVADVQALERAGVAGVLVASALHDGRLGRGEIGD